MSTKGKRKTSKQVFTLKDLNRKFGPVTMAKTIRSWRLCEEYTLQKCADLLGVKRSYICDVEKGRTLVSPVQAVRFAKIMGEPEEGLMGIAVEDLLRRDGLKHFKVSVEKKKAA